MRRMRVSVIAILAAGVMGFGLAGAASADIITSAPTVTPFGGGLFEWTYDLSLTSDNSILANNGSQPCTTTGTLGDPSQCSFFTLFDVRGLTGTPSFTSAVSGLTGSVSTPDSGPVAFGSSVPDDPAVPNLDVAFTNGTGADLGSPTSSTTLGTLSFFDTNGSSMVGVFSAQANLGDASVSGVQSSADVPTPEPAPLALFGLGLVGFAPFLWRRRRQP